MFINFLKIIFTTSVIVFSVFVSWGPIKNLKADFIAKYFPCKQPILYSIGTFDPKFGISKEEFITDIARAASVWEKPINRKLFVYSPTGDLKINLIYDYRQDAAVTLKKLGTNIDGSLATYLATKKKYTELQIAYKIKKIAFELLVAKYHTTGEGYSNVLKAQQDINADVSQINSTVVVLNTLATQLNMTVSKYNQIGKETGGEFDEALYVQNNEGNHIDVYEYTSKDKLVRVLTHELGHALGFAHVDNPDAIMYKINQSSNTKLTADDLNQLYTKCQIKK